MLDVMCFDRDGNQLDYLSQWDLNRIVKFDVTGYTVSGNVQVHFSNSARNAALVVNATYANNAITATIPNELLKEPHALFAYLFAANDERKTIAFATIPVRKRNRPSDYFYSDDAEIITLDKLVGQVQQIVEQYGTLDIDEKIQKITTIIADYEQGSVIAEGAISYAKLAPDVKKLFTDTNTEFGKKMDKSVYDPRNLGDNVGDIYGYAKAKADEVADTLNKYKQSNDTLINKVNGEIQNAKKFGNTTSYDTLLDALDAVLAEAEKYTRQRLADFNAFSVRVVDSIDFTQAGEGQTFYLVPKETGNGFDKYWWITDEITGESRWDSFGASSTIVVDALPAKDDADPNADYILKTSSGCVYYKFIDGNWEVIAGSTAVILEELPTTGNELTDYYVKNEDGAFVHYRWIDGEFVAVGSDSFTKDEVNEMLKNLPQMNGRIESLEASTKALNDATTQIGNKVTVLQNTMDGQKEAKEYDIDYDETTGTFSLIEDNNVKSSVVIKGGGGSGSDVVTSTMTMTPITPNPYIVLNGKTITVDFDFSDTDPDGSIVSATAYVTIDGKIVVSGIGLEHGANSIDITKYMTVGSKKVRVYCSDDYGSKRYKEWTIRVVDISIASSYNDRYTNAIGRTVSIPYTPVGNVVKTVHFLLNGEEIDTLETSSTGTVLSYSLDARPHGSYLFEMFISAFVGGTYVETDHVFKDIIWYDESKTTPVVGCYMRSDYYGIIESRQYDTIPIVFNAFDPKTSAPKYTIVVDGAIADNGVMPDSQGVYRYKGDNIGKHDVDIYIGDVVFTYADGKVNGVNAAKSRYAHVNVSFDIEKLNIDVAPITGNLEIDFNPIGKSNNSVDRIWSNSKYSMEVSPNFDWANGGYHSDENGDDYFLIKAGTRATFNYHMFDTTRTSSDVIENATTYGAEMKLTFMTENVQDKDAIWFTNVGSISGDESGTKMGIQLSVHEGWLKTNNASATDVTSGEGDDAETVAATNTYLYMPYSEEDIIELDINIDTIDKADSNAKSFVMAYEDGVPSKAFVYDNSDNFYQASPKPIVIGSDYCDVRVYRLKIYSTSLSTENIMKNFIADSRDSTTMLARYDRNCIYYNSDRAEYTPYKSEGVLDPERLAPKVPNVKVLMLETDHFTTSKKTFVKSMLRCIHAEGGNLYEGDPYFDNWLAEYMWHSGQGTTSDNYGNAGRNVDFLFNCDGKRKPSDKVNAEADYVSQVTLGYGTENEYTEKCTDWKGDSGKVTLTRTSVPNNFFNLKVNIASSENVNNALMQKRYNDYLPYISPAKKRDARIKNDMEFVPAILFLRETNPDISAHNEFLDTNYHFYALGNLGDSKKTDYTRAYDPEDKNEFTIEISDNTKNNATFQSGVYMENGQRKVEEIGDTGVHQYIYPITEAEWNDNNQRKHYLYNEAFDGDHSFEPRYACCGDYRDGKLVNDTGNGGKEQILKNNDVWRAFYRWVITSTNEQFVNELDQWCVRSAVEFFYAFTHYYTMMDNRAKNTFWHYAKTGEFRAVSRPVSELLHIYCEKIGSDYVTTSDTEIKSGKTYYTQYAFDLWDYDNDTALGINNNGELVFPYGKEDSDYNIEDNPSSGYIFNGATSVFWCRLRDLLQSEIRNTFNTVVSADCFRSTSLINQFDKFQDCYPEEIWRLDIERKYIRTFTGESVDNSKPKHDVQYLRDMMQGKKKYQRRQWVRDQEVYFGTMNLMNTVVGDDNRITFRCFTPTGSIAVRPDYTLRITPFCDMYLSVMFGNGGTQQVRAKGGQEYTILCPLTTMDDTQVTIYCANRIAALNDLSACYIAANNFSMATKLRKLVIGNTNPRYVNSRLVSLTLGNNALLEELDIRNCGNLTGSLNLAQCSNLLKLYAEGTKLTGVIFATNGKINTAHLPSTINTLEMRNLYDLTDFDVNLDKLEVLTLEGGNLDNYELIKGTVDTLQRLYLYNIDWTISDTGILNQLSSLFFSLITGKVYVDGIVRIKELDTYSELWSDLEINYDPRNVVTQYKVDFYDYDGTLLFTEYVDIGSDGYDPVAAGEIAKPERPSDAQYIYDFDGWDDNLQSVIGNRTVHAKYKTTTRTYTVKWYAYAGNLLQEKVCNYGDDVVYEGEQPTRTDLEASFRYALFNGWNKCTSNIKEDTDVYAIWEMGELPQVGKAPIDMTPAEIYGVATAGRVASYFENKDPIKVTMGSDFNYENVETYVFAEEVELDGKTAVATGIKPMQEDRSWTIAIDYEYYDYANSMNCPLVSCYDLDGTDGFEIYYNGGVNLKWSTQSTKIGYQNYRNMVVIRHRKGDKNIYAYIFENSQDANYTTNVTTAIITRTNKITVTDAEIILGARKDYYDGSYGEYTSGMVHWGKIWYEDLGASNCLELASWCHETMTYEYIQPTVNNRTGGYRLSSGNGYCAASFIQKSLLSKLMQMNTANTNVGGYPTTRMRTFLNNKVYNGFSRIWKQIIKQVQIKSSAGNQSYEIVTSDDYVYLSSYSEYSGSTAEPYANEVTNITYIKWFTSDRSRIAFRGIEIPDNATYFVQTKELDPLVQTPSQVKEGDVWIQTNNSNIGFILHKGKWVQAQWYWDRSPYVGNASNFWIVGTYGNYNYSNNSYNFSGVRAGFSI